MNLNLWNKMYVKYVAAVCAVNQHVENLKYLSDTSGVIESEHIDTTNKAFNSNNRYILEIAELYTRLSHLCMQANILDNTVQYPTLRCEDQYVFLVAIQNKSEEDIYYNFGQSLIFVTEALFKRFGVKLEIDNLGESFRNTLINIKTETRHEENANQFFGSSREALKFPEGLHKSTTEVLTIFFKELASKLFQSQEQYGLSEGWSVVPEHVNKEELGKGRFFVNADQCRESLIAHLEKGDILDSVAYLIYLRSLTGNKTMKPLKIISDIQDVKRKPHIVKANAFIDSVRKFPDYEIAKLITLGGEGNIFIRVFDHYENKTEIVNGVTVVYTTEPISKFAVRGHTTLGIFHEKNFVDHNDELSRACFNAMASCVTLGLPTQYSAE